MKQTIRRTLLVRILAVILAAVVASGNVTPVYAAQKSSAVTKAERALLSRQQERGIIPLLSSILFRSQ